jgi:hypothetical protein
VRTFTNLDVHQSIRLHVLQALRELHSVSEAVVFLHLKRHDVSGMRGWPNRVVATSGDAAFYTAVAALDPATLEIGDGAIVKGRLQCPQRYMHVIWGTADAALNNLFMNHRCHDMMERYEEVRNMTFTHIVRTRPDLTWTANISAPDSWPVRGARLHDWVYLLPRRLAGPILEAPYRMLEACRDPYVQTFLIDSAMWMYGILDRTQLAANISTPMCYHQGGRDHRVMPKLPAGGDTMSKVEADVLFPVRIERTKDAIDAHVAVPVADTST